MATLLGDELYDYLSHLTSELDKRISTSKQGSLQNLMHSQTRRVLDAEREFLKYVNLNGTKPVLSISPNGLPSVDSLRPDLEKICELSQDNEAFRDVGQQFRKGMSGKNRGEEGHLYLPVSEDEWGKELESKSKEKLQSQIGFAVSEAEDGKFQISLREDIHLQGYDQHSKDFPVLIREGKIKYNVIWNRLIEDTEESFYVPNTALVLQGRPNKPSEKKFDNISRFYSFSNSDFKGVRKPWFMTWRQIDSIDYASFLSAGTNARVRKTENILEAIGKALERKVILKGVGKNDLGSTLAFSTIPFKNAPRTVLAEEDFYNWSNGRNNKHPTKFDLIFTTGGDKIGNMEYILPYNRRIIGGDLSRDYYRFTKGGIILTVLGESVYNEEQYNNLKNNLQGLYSWKNTFQKKKFKF